MKRKYLFLCIIACAMLLACENGPRIVTFTAAAVAVSEDGKYFGAANDEISLNSAKVVAERKCKKKGGKKCRIVASCEHESEGDRKSSAIVMGPASNPEEGYVSLVCYGFSHDNAVELAKIDAGCEDGTFCLELK